MATLSLALQKRLLTAGGERSLDITIDANAGECIAFKKEARIG
jgi:hypothetical protein